MHYKQILRSINPVKNSKKRLAVSIRPFYIFCIGKPSKMQMNDMKQTKTDLRPIRKSRPLLAWITVFSLVLSLVIPGTELCCDCSSIGSAQLSESCCSLPPVPDTPPCCSDAGACSVMPCCENCTVHSDSDNTESLPALLSEVFQFSSPKSICDFTSDSISLPTQCGIKPIALFKPDWKSSVCPLHIATTVILS